jgi:hypothetical protein
LVAVCIRTPVLVFSRETTPDSTVPRVADVIRPATAALVTPWPSREDGVMRETAARSEHSVRAFFTQTSSTAF